ncbi:MAG: amino acid adenylation domain-containing protein, partial [Gemmatimonadaceae bacterium]
LLHRYTGEQEFLVGSVANGRSQAALSGVVGYFVNTLALRATVSAAESFAMLLRRTRDAVLEAMRHQGFPFARAVEQLRPSRESGDAQLLQVMFVFQQAEPADAAVTQLALGEAGVMMDWGGLHVTSLRVEQGWSQFDLTITLAEVDGALHGSAEYDTDLFDRETIERMVEHFRALLAGAVANPSTRVGELPLSIAAAASSSPSRPDAQLIQQRFEAAVQRAPHAIALTFDGGEITYGELNRRANRLAHHLRRLGVGPEIPVALCIEPSFDMVVAILGILKAGGMYVPLDPTNPGERLAMILGDVGATIVVCAADVPEVLRDGAAYVVLLGAVETLAAELPTNPTSLGGADNAAYVIYTSGSTGAPKGSVVTHRNVVRLFDETSQWFAFDERDVWTLFHSVAFDFSVWELWGALFHGGRLVIVPAMVRRSPDVFHDTLVRERVTVLNQTPSAFYQLMAADGSAQNVSALSLRLVIFGGEALTLPRLAPWFERHGDATPQLVNMFGITETTVHVTYRPLSSADARAGTGSAIGAPIPDLQVYLLDPNFHPVPVGVAGELYVGGAGLARGYLSRPALTAERFIPHPFSRTAGERLYRSGDLARLRSNGDIEYLGRIDSQVKIRGFRVEPGEIEASLSAHASVRDAAVVARGDEDGGTQLVAYVVARPLAPPPTVAMLREHLGAGLPAYMVPSTVVFLDALPLTPNGKLDVRRLPAPTTNRVAAGDDYAPPRTDAERVLAEIWCEVLRVDSVGIHDNFFALGGDSIRSVQVASKARARGLTLSVAQLFQHQDIATLAAQLGDVVPGRDPEPAGLTPFALVSAPDREKVPEGIEDAYPLAMLQAGSVYHAQSRTDYETYVSSFHLRAAFDESAFGAALRRLGERHAFFRTSIDLTTFSEPLQLVQATVDLPVVVADIGHLSADAQEAVLREFVAEQKRRPFEWGRAPLARFFVHRRSPSSIQVTMCEPLLDGWSVANVVADLLRDYQWLLAGKALPDRAPRPSVSYAEFVALERGALDSAAAQRYWAHVLDDVQMSALPRNDRATEREAAPTTPVVRVNVAIEPALSDRLHDVARRERLPLKSVL